MSQDDVFNILHYFTWWQLAIIGVLLAVAVFFLASTKRVWWLGLLPLLVVFVLPNYNIGVIVYGVAALGVFIVGMRWGEKRRAKQAEENPTTPEQIRQEQEKRLKKEHSTGKVEKQ